MEAEVWGWEVGREKMGLGGGGCAVYVACRMCLFCDGLGRGDSEGGEWVLKEWNLVYILEWIFGIVFPCFRHSLARLEIESLNSTSAGNGYPAVGFEQRKSRRNERPASHGRPYTLSQSRFVLALKD